MKSGIRTEIITYFIDQQPFKAFLAVPNSETPSPGVIIAPAWKGADAVIRKKAEALAELGYVAFVADLYGNGTVVETDEEAAALMFPLFVNRKLLRLRMKAAHSALLENPLVDKTKIAAIGFCFGGSAAIELLKSGADLRGVAAFHALLGNSLGGHQATIEPISSEIKGKLLILHGNDDPFVCEEDIIAIKKEMTDTKIDWQMIIYGQTVHAFTNFNEQNPAKGLVYQPLADKRSWLAMRNFFEEIFV